MARTVPIATNSIPVRNGHGLLARMQETYDAIARRAYQLFEARGGAHGRDFDDWLHAEAEFLRPMRAAWKETESSYEVTAEVPGFDLAHLSVSLEDHHLVVQGSCQQKHEGVEAGARVRSAAEKQVMHVLSLPEDVRQNEVKATLEQGVLRVTLPRKVAAPTAVPTAA